MARKKKTADAAKDKAAKQKKIVIGLVVFLALAMAYAFHTMSGLSGGAPSSSKPQPNDASTVVPPSAAAPVAAPTTSLAPSLAGAPLSSSPSATSSSTDTSQLISVVIPKADPGQLGSFTRFASKDPFANGTAAAPASGGSKGSGSSGGSGATPKTPPAPPAPPPTSAVIAINGTSESVASGANFPAANPVATTNGLFQLVSLTAHSATVAVVGGSYASGSSTLTLKENKPVTLVNTADGTRYTLVLYPQGSVAPAAPVGGSSSPSSPVVPSAPSAPGTTTTSGP